MAITKTNSGWRADLRSPLILGLILLLALQVLIALGQRLSAPAMTATTPSTPLITLAAEAVTQITIEGPEQNDQLLLSRSDDGHWVIADLANLPVMDAKVESLLKAATTLKRPLPVATSAQARQRFKVGDENFVRRLTLTDADAQSETLILGETPGFRRLFGRPANDPAVYDLPLALADISSRRDDWVQTGLLRLDQDSISAVTGQDWTLSKTPDGWRLDDSTEPFDQDAARDLVMQLANLSYRGVLGIEDDPAYNQHTPVQEFAIQLDDDSTRSYRISQTQDSTEYVLKDTDRPYYFKLSEYDLAGLLDADRSKFIIEPEPSPEPAAPENPDETTETPLQ